MGMPSGHNLASVARDAAGEVAATLAAAGHVAYFAGGCVRDRLRGETPKDYDIATDATPASIKRLFPRALGVGEAFGVMLVRRSGTTIEVATFRQDGEYLDGRRPDSIRFGSAEEDARRRDFTINGIFEDPATGAIIDFVGGRDDLRQGIIRAIGDPAARLDEDRLRALRAVRFAARFHYAIEPATRDAVAAASDLRGVSRERVGHELRRMLPDPGRAKAIAEIEALGLDAAVLREPRASTDLRRIKALPAHAGFEATLAAWLLDRPDSMAPMATDPRRRLVSWSQALVLSNAELDLAAATIAIEPRLRGVQSKPAPCVGSRRSERQGRQPWSILSVAGRKRLASSPGFTEARMLVDAADPALGEAIATELTELSRTGLAPTPLVTGDDLVRELGLTPGPRFGHLLETVYDAQLDGRVASRAAAVAMAAKLAEAG